MTEMVVVIAIITILMTAGIRVLGGTSSQSRKSATDTVTGLIEQARTTAITSRSIIVMAIAEPGDLPASDKRCRVGLFRVPAWPTDPTTVEAVADTVVARVLDHMGVPHRLTVRWQEEIE
jgi:4-hydroxy-3-polyprenylbenzoate decarboxylase